MLITRKRKMGVLSKIFCGKSIFYILFLTLGVEIKGIKLIRIFLVLHVGSIIKVARAGIEPATQGFSVLIFNSPKYLLLFNL
tara:strand:- start:106 stop:351 length:246 start_codon:yes stop_codon:yes gene_type:complete